MELSTQPATIEELEQWYAARHLPPEEVTRFFIGKNITEPKAFGIYKDEQGAFVVYKNKASGERAIRYQGPDEAFAVGELLQRLKDEILRQKESGSISAAMQSDEVEYEPTKMSNWELFKEVLEEHTMAVLAGVVFVLAIFVGCFRNNIPKGYYYYQGNSYYYQRAVWYLYDAEHDQWTTTSDVKGINGKNARQYRQLDFSGSKFEDSEWYVDDSSYDWNDRSSYGGSDSWDSNSTDWDSDW